LSDRRKALIEKFRAGSIDRIRKITSVLHALEEGNASAEAADETARELHTLKGESRMLGFGSISDLVHGIEDRFLQNRAAPQPRPDVFARCSEALDMVARALRNELGEGTATDAQLAAAKLALLSYTTSTDSVPSSPPVVAPTENAPSTTERKVAATERWIQVSAQSVDQLCERIFDFVAEFRALREQLRQQQAKTSRGMSPEARAFHESFDRCRSGLTEITDATWSLRLVPVAPVLDDLSRHCRELAKEQGKKLRCTVVDAGALVERSVLDRLWEPLVHLIRNAVDHGIEPPAERGSKPPEASLKLATESVGGSVVFSIADDGRGIDAAKVRAAIVTRGLASKEAAAVLTEEEIFDYLFMHGFSTRTEVTALSGRGVGLDVVRGVVEDLGGTIELTSQLGKGSRFTLTVPAAVTTERVLVVQCNSGLFAIPSRQVREVLTATNEHIETVAGGRAISSGDHMIPLRSLSGALAATLVEEERSILVVDLNNRRWALSVPMVLGEYDLVRRPLDETLSSLDYLSGSMLLDDGRLVLMLALGGVLRRAGLDANAPRAQAARPTRPQCRVLVVDDSVIVRDLVSQTLVGAGFAVRSAPEGKEALKLIEIETPDLVFCDVDMPGIDGFEVLTQIRLRYATLPVVMLTTRSSQDDRRRAASLGADAYMAKSEFEEESLLALARRFTQQATS
jgi:chemotaxis protein histidine kinase CheA/ActR/RegA family two-component response regulator